MFYGGDIRIYLLSVPYFPNKIEEFTYKWVRRLLKSAYNLIF
jgi:hypothetical protein